MHADLSIDCIVYRSISIIYYFLPFRFCFSSLFISIRLWPFAVHVDFSCFRAARHVIFNFHSCFFFLHFFSVASLNIRYCRSGDHTAEREIEGGFIDSAGYICGDITAN